MKLDEYFQNISGIGILSTANKDGEVDAAIFAAPHVQEENQMAFIMRDRLTHKNLQSNPFAIYLFMENGGYYKGTRFFLKKIREDTDPKLIESMTRRHLPPDEDKARGPKFAVFFEITKTLPLVGTGKEHIAT
ncbi:MAG: pyridoxamine 5'-phosphate oxidase family protein [Desulfobulbaceae bacterium]|nr:pyridoxamine 5'-phosphate oxidase family protein [Desulfobulbaceae bacterium]